MGVLACDRRGCNQIMCDYYSSLYGYICTDCLEELKARAPAISIAAFMDEEKTTSSIGLERQTALNEIEMRRKRLKASVLSARLLSMKSR